MPTEDSCLSFNKFYYNYARFHDHPTNKLIHIVWIPILTFTAGVFSAQIRFPGDLGLVPWIVALTFSVIYGLIRIQTGIWWFLWSVPSAYLCNVAQSNYHVEIAGYTIYQICVILHILGWIF